MPNIFCALRLSLSGIFFVPRQISILSVQMGWALFLILDFHYISFVDIANNSKYNFNEEASETLHFVITYSDCSKLGSYLVYEFF